MPIKPENRARYPKDWKQIRARILLRAGNKCEQCGVANHQLGGRGWNGKWHKAVPVGEKLLRLEWPRPGDKSWCSGSLEPLRIIRIVLTIAHLDHTPENCADDNLKAMCQRCHLTYDAKHHAETAHATRHARKAIGELFA